MATDSFTSGYPREKIENLSKEIESAIRELKKAFPGQDINALNWDKNSIAIPLDVEVSRPSRGTADDIDIREKEPIFLLLDRQNYPYKVPSVYYNRKDFPAERLPHLNPTFDGIPASFCLHRGSIDNWFAEHTITDLVYKTGNWLSDASKGHLIRKEDGFEPTRINYGLIYSIFDPEIFWNIIENKWKQNQGQSGFIFLWCKLSKTPNKLPLIGIDSYAIQLIQPIMDGNLSKFIEGSQEINCLPIEKNKIDRRLFGILVWTQKNQVCNRFFAQLPSNIIEFQKWAEDLGIPLTVALKKYLSENLNVLGTIPVIIIVQRPQKLIGKQSKLEPITFIIKPDFENQHKVEIFSQSTKVIAIEHRDPLTLKIARHISSRSHGLYRNRLLFLGCGAIGSKLIFHLARSGQGNMTLVDYDTISPHNLVRHALLNGCIGQNKAEAVKNAITEMFDEDKEIKINIMKESALNLFLGNRKYILNQHDWIIDTTASPIMLNVLLKTVLPKTISCCRCEIADGGRLGILSIEGHKRNPRLDDLQVAVFDMATTKQEISRWLQSNSKQREEEIGSRLSEIYIGISCSSETMQLSDEVVSLHAAYFSIGFRKIAVKKATENGQIQISQYNEDEFEVKSETFLGATQHFEVPPVTVVQARNDSNWQVRLKGGVEKSLHSLYRQALPNETGGILIGRINQKAKIIYITDFLKAPKDSTSSPYAFKRGIDDVPEEINKINELTGGMLGYVGEWHTHPKGETRLSSIDESTAKAIKKHLDSIPLPTHIMIVTKNGLHPYIYRSREVANS